MVKRKRRSWSRASCWTKWDLTSNIVQDATSIIKTNFIDTSTIMVGWNFLRKNYCLFVNNPIAYPAAKIPEQVKILFVITMITFAHPPTQKIPLPNKHKPSPYYQTISHPPKDHNKISPPHNHDADVDTTPHSSLSKAKCPVGKSDSLSHH